MMLIPVRTWESEPYRLELSDTGRFDSMGKHILAYKFYHNGHLIFEGADFCPSPCHPINSDKTVGSLLGFLSLRKGDTDDEYFDKYTHPQLDFSRDCGEDLSIYAADLEGE